MEAAGIPLAARLDTCLAGSLATEAVVVAVLIAYLLYLGCVFLEYNLKNQHTYSQLVPRYHDHVIRNINDYNNISTYIENNIANWYTDCFFI